MHFGSDAKTHKDNKPNTDAPEYEIADVLTKAGIIDVDRRTVTNWLGNFGTDAEISKPDKPNTDAPEYEIPTVTAKSLKVAESTARMLTKDARGARAVEAKSLVRVLHDKKVPQEEIAEMLAKAGIVDVEQQTVANWLTNFGTDAEIGKPNKAKSNKPEYEIPTVTAKQITDWRIRF